MSKLLIGWSEVNITPDKKYLLMVSLPSGSPSMLKSP